MVDDYGAVEDSSGDEAAAEEDSDGEEVCEIVQYFCVVLLCI